MIRLVSDPRERCSLEIGIPTYNRRAYLKRAIHSVLAQTAGDLELIVMDDASTDGTPELVRAIVDPRLRYFRNDVNSGVSATRTA